MKNLLLCLIVSVGCTFSVTSAFADSETDRIVTKVRTRTIDQLGEIQVLMGKCPKVSFEDRALELAFLLADLKMSDLEEGGEFRPALISAASRYAIAYEPYDPDWACARAFTLYGGNDKHPGMLKIPK